jgi:hypothetical protein
MSKSSSSSRSGIDYYFKDNHGYDYYKREDCYRRKGGHIRKHCCGDEISYSIINTDKHSDSKPCSYSSSRHHHHIHHKHRKS